jgi:hypothetical protein
LEMLLGRKNSSEQIHKRTSQNISADVLTPIYMEDNPELA